MSDPGRRHGLSSAGKSLSISVDSNGFPVMGRMGFALTSTFDAWTAGYAEPGFCGTAGLTLAGVGVALSTFGIIVGVTDFDTGADESMDDGRWDSFRRLAWRGCSLVENQKSEWDGFRKDNRKLLTLLAQEHREEPL